MRILEPRIVVTELLFVLTLVSGAVLSHAGKPYNTAIFTVHKLIALAAVIAIALTIRHLGAGVNPRLLTSGAIALTSLLFLSLLVTGALLSIGKPDHVAILAVHRSAPFLAALAAGADLYLLAQV